MSNAERQFKYRNGYARGQRLSRSMRWAHVQIRSGRLTSLQSRLVEEIMAGKVTVYPHRTTIGGRPRRILQTASAPAFVTLLATFGLEYFVIEGSDEPWILKTAGTCAEHVDSYEKATFSLLICVETKAPYEMEFSSNTDRTGGEMHPVRMSAGSWVIFPSKLLHRCRASPSNTRTILNAVCKRIET